MCSCVSCYLYGQGADKTVPERGLCGNVRLEEWFHHVDMAEKHWKHLGFQWEGKYYCFKSLLVGLSTAPYLFNKLVSYSQILECTSDQGDDVL